MDREVLTQINGNKIKVIDAEEDVKTFDIMKVFGIDEDNLTKEFQSQSAVYAYFSTLAAAAEDRMRKAEFKKEQEYARSDTWYRKEAENNNQKLTEPMVKAKIIMDEDYTQAVEEENTAIYEFKVLKAIVSAMEQRSNMLISLGSHVRHESSMTGMNIRDGRESDIDAAVKGVKSVIQSRRYKTE